MAHDAANPNSDVSYLPETIGGGGATVDSTAVDIKSFGAQSAGVSSEAAAADHVHPMAGKIYAFSLYRYAP